MNDKLRDAAQQAEREAFEAWVAKVQPAYWRAEAWQTEAWAMWQSISAALAQQDAQTESSIVGQNKLLADALASCILASGIVRKDIDGLTGPQLLLFAEDLREMLEAKSAQQDAQAVPQGYKLVPVELLEKLAPESPMNQDELGGCVWCAGTPPGEEYGYAGADPTHHEHDCAWVETRTLLNAAPTPPGACEPLTDEQTHEAIPLNQDGHPQVEPTIAKMDALASAAGIPSWSLLKRKAELHATSSRVTPTAQQDAQTVPLPEHETEAMHEAVMDVIYQGVTRTNTDALWRAYRSAQLNAATTPPAQQYAQVPHSTSPTALRPYDPTEQMRWAAKQLDPALTHEQIRTLWCAMWSAAPTPPAQQPDDAAVDAFGQTMKAKLAAARAKGRGGWQTCPPQELSRMLREHVEKGDPVDVANFCMFLWTLGTGIETPVQQNDPCSEGSCSCCWTGVDPQTTRNRG